MAIVTFQQVLKRRNPRAGDPFTAGELRAVNTLASLAEYKVLQARLRRDSARAWAEAERREREDQAAAEWAAAHGKDF